VTSSPSNPSSAPGRVRVQLVQPVIPRYRVALYTALSRAPGICLRVKSSARVSGNPPSVGDSLQGADASFPCRELLGGRLFWQEGLQLDRDLEQGDVVILDGNPRFASNWPLMLAARRRRIGVVWWGHGWSATSQPLRAGLRRRLMSLCDVLLLYTDAERDEYLRMGFAADRVFAANNALDQAAIRMAAAAWPEPRLAEFRHAEGLEGRRLLLFCGRLRTDPPTELDVALQALRRLRAGDDSYLLAVIGDGEDAARLRGLSDALELGRAVRWLGSVYDETAVAPWFMSAECFVYPGPIGLSLLQAFGYGLPVLTHDRRREHNPEIAALEDWRNGGLFPRGDAAALARCIRRIGTESGLREALGAEARRTVEQRYTTELMVERFLAAVRTASERVSRPSRAVVGARAGA